MSFMTSHNKLRLTVFDTFLPWVKIVVSIAQFVIMKYSKFLALLRFSFFIFVRWIWSFAFSHKKGLSDVLIILGHVGNSLKLADPACSGKHSRNIVFLQIFRIFRMFLLQLKEENMKNSSCFYLAICLAFTFLRYPIAARDEGFLVKFCQLIFFLH